LPPYAISIHSFRLSRHFFADYFAIIVRASFRIAARGACRARISAQRDFAVLAALAIALRS